MATVPFTRFDSSDLAGPDSFDLWREVLRGSYDLTAAVRQQPSLRISTGMWEGERLVIGYCRSEAARVDRRGTLVGHSGRFLKLRWFSRGSVRLVHGGATTVIGPGAVHLIDQSREIVEISSRHEQRSVFLPHVAIGYDPARHPVWASFPIDTPTGRVLAETMTLFHEQLPRATAVEAPALEEGFLGLLRGLLSGAIDSAGDAATAASRAAAMKRHLDRHLHDPALGVETLLRAFGAARTTIFRDFQAVGGVQRYILERRLERAFAQLASSPGRRGIVREVSEAWGFTSTGHFARRFQEHYGLRPGEVVGLNARAGDDVPAPAPPAAKRPDPDPQALSRVYQRIAGAWG